ncbi:FAD-dependent monooxygenase [Streptomyces sp. NPDC058420]|uniref:FAD-dependent monooxygenase n=1 Tax=Streptomyces sp. NPDC058420 TaxID=3346489 RepID=UPI0036460C16
MSGEEVIVVGAGPVGLWLARELRLAGVPVVVLERAVQRAPHSKALGIHPRTIEVLAMRGLAGPFLDGGVKVPAWHFAMLDNRLDFRTLPTPFPFMLAHPQVRTEELLEAAAVELGVRILRGHTVTGLTEDPDGTSVTVEVTGQDGVPHPRRARFVVGCDGAGSTVRKAAGIDFPGTDATLFGFLGDVQLDAPPKELGLVWHSEHGTLTVAPAPGGLFRVMGYDAAHQDPAEELTLDQLRETAIRLAGSDFGMRDPGHLSRFGNATRQAATYRKGRVLLAGDAAHMAFPAGGVGLNVGVQDAMNLGWKLAAVVQHRATPDLLDSYQSERHPVGRALAEHTLAQTQLITTTSPEGKALRSLLSGLIASQPRFSRELAMKLSALDVAYPATDPDAHPLTGARAPDLVSVEDGRSLFSGVLRQGRPVLLDFSGSGLGAAAKQAASLGVPNQASRLAPHSDPAWSAVGAALIRPDGHVWWAADKSADLETDASHALQGLGYKAELS